VKSDLACTPERVDAVMGRLASFHAPANARERWWGQIDGGTVQLATMLHCAPLAAAVGETLAECVAALRASVVRCWGSICEFIEQAESGVRP
jgi:hypothetical protein